jgi:hypothetical protein
VVCVLLDAGTRDDPLPATGSFAMKLVKSVRSCPVLVVKANSRGPYLRSDNGAMGEQLLCSMLSIACKFCMLKVMFR